MAELYDLIGAGYRTLRVPDARIAAALTRALAASESVVNVGAGSGSYEPRDRRVLAIEPALTMIQQRTPGSPRVVRASASALPLRDASFDAALAVLTIHHWPDAGRGLAELARVARERVVLLTWDPAHPKFWIADYFPTIVDIDVRIFPPLALLRRALGPLCVETLPIPHDCSDGFLGAYWRRPREYLRGDVRAAISTFARLPEGELRAGLSRLSADLSSGAWRERFGGLLELEELDLGYRVVIARR